ncbi:MAG: hypothetical protein IKR52_05725 [Paludibacteraceae bacterium]|nr:hypothetical protein [Paludibacteraceae bacterium]
MGYKSVITTWKKIQDWVLELLEGLGFGTAYKYDKASDTATVKAGTIKNESGSFAWINSLGQWIINLGTNIAETWGILNAEKSDTKSRRYDYGKSCAVVALDEKNDSVWLLTGYFNL